MEKIPKFEKITKGQEFEKIKSGNLNYDNDKMAWLGQFFS